MSRKISTKEATFRQWFASKNGNQFENFESYTLPDTIANLDRAWQQDMGAKLPVSFNFSMDKLRMIESEIQESGTFDIHLDVINSGLLIPDTVTDAAATTILPNSGQQGTLNIPQPQAVEFIVEKIDDMEFPDFKLHRTDTVIDKIMSDHTPEGGLYGGTVTIVVGESGSGKSTLLIDYLAKVKEKRDEYNKTSVEIQTRIDERLAAGRFVKKNKDLQKRYRSYLTYTNELKVLYISTEMTKNDIYFYKKKMPKIGCVPTLLAMNYIKGGLKDVIIQAFEKKFDIILLDSYQDLVEKLKDLQGWKATYAANFLINLMVESAERRGTAVLAIQHQTKGGEYVGSTFLKHTTTAMLELRFDGNRRFASYSKNRRGGSMQNIPVYFDLKDGDIVYDKEAFNMRINAAEMSESESEKNKELNNKFTEVFQFAQNVGDQNFDDDDNESVE